MNPTKLLPVAAAILFLGGLAIVPAHAGDAGVNPYSPAKDHPWRHGATPTLAVRAAMLRWERAHGLATGSKTLAFGGGGTSGVGVTSGISKVYLVFWGSQWGSSSTDANGNLQFSADTAGAAGAAQQFFKGIGTNGEKWSAGLTQWCDGAGVATGATSCPATGANYVPYQQYVQALEWWNNNAPAVWYDNASAAPAAATAQQLGQEAVRASQHFGNQTKQANVHTYYVILSPPGTDPDHFKGNNCGWHSDTVQVGAGQVYGNLPFSSQPYNLDAGAQCGQNFVNSGSAGLLDGYTIALGQQWQGMMADTLPSGGWTNQGTGTYAGDENAAECAWIAPGSPGGAANVKFATGTFALASNWSNDTNQCAMTHAIVFRNEPPTANFSYVVNGARVNYTDKSTDVDGNIVSYAWNFYDSGTSTLRNPAHTYVYKCTYPATETVTDDHGLSNSTSFWLVQPVATKYQICNPGFEYPTSDSEYAYWNGHSGVICIADTACPGESPHTGVGFALFNGVGSADRDQDQSLQNLFVLTPTSTKATLIYWLHIDTHETTTTDKIDKLTVALYDSRGNWVKDLQVYSNLQAASGYQRHSSDVSAYINPSGIAAYNVRFTYTHSAESSLNTNFTVDDVTVSQQ